MAKWQNGEMAEWQNSKIAELQNGEMAKEMGLPQPQELEMAKVSKC